jgi:hypothetical protein
MSPRPFYLLLAALGLLGVACSDHNGGAPSAPQDEGFDAAVESLICDFNGFNSLIAQYFTKSSTQQEAKAFVSAMQSADPVDNGFNVMALIAGAVKRGEVGSPITGSSLTNALIKCMFDVTTGDFVTGTGPAAKSIIPIDFTASLDPAQPGAYDVHGGAGDGTTDAVKSRLIAGATDPISAIGTQGRTWANLLSERALIYGRPIGDAPSLTSYQWEAVRPNVSFSQPGALVAICAATGNDEMVDESGFGVLGFGSAAGLCPDPREVAISGWGPGALAARLGRLLTPEPLHAATLLLKSIGGSAGGLKSVFSKKTISSGRLEFLSLAPSPKANSPITVTVKATSSDGVPMNGVTVTLAGTNNNGTPTKLVQSDGITCSNNTPPSGVTGNKGLDVANVGVAEIKFCITKTGGLLLTGNGNIAGRSLISVTPTKPLKLNVRP